MSEDDELMEALGAAARERREEEPDARWDALAAGELGEDERAALREAAEARGEDVEALEAAFGALGEEAEEGFAAAILAGAGAASTGAEGDASAEASAPAQASASAPAEASAPAQASAPARAAAPGRARAEASAEARSEAPASAPAERGSKVTTLSSRRAVLGLVGTLAVAAAVLFVVLPRGGPALPGYTATVRGGAQSSRGADEAPAATPTFRADDIVDLRLRPETEVSFPVHAAVFRRRAGGELERVDVAPAVAGSGAVRLQLLAAELLPEPGRWTVYLVAAPAEIPIEDLHPPGGHQALFTLARE